MNVGAHAAVHAAQHDALVQAVKAQGVIVHVDPEDFLALVRSHPEVMIVRATGGFFRTVHQYLTSYKGLAFYTKSNDELDLPTENELVAAGKIWVPE